ncbi:hypothetical protein BVX98_01460, partial [bacterium F11]
MGQEAQLRLFELTREIRNAERIEEVQPDKLVLRVYNPKLGYDSNSSLIFTPVAIGSITYQFRQDSSQLIYLEKTTFYPSVVDPISGVTVSREFFQKIKLFTNRIIYPTATNFIFEILTTNAAGLPTSVNIAFRMKTPKLDRSRIFRATAITRKQTFL